MSSSFVKLPHLTYVLNKSTAVGSNNYSIKIDYKNAVNLDEEQLTFSGNIRIGIHSTLQPCI
jgi:hypothetical protein